MEDKDLIVPEVTREQIKQNLDKDSIKLLSELSEDKTSDQMKDLVSLFNLTHTKKQMLRTLTYDELLDHITKQMEERVVKRADQFSNRDLLDYLNAMNTSLEKAQKQISDVDAIPVIQLNQQNNIINVGNADIGANLPKESRERILAAISKIINKADEKNISEVSEIEEPTVYIDDPNSNVDLEIKLNEEEET